ncbi:MAG: phosphonate ABC transporter substrate-binding protein [Betaproteobacteria bacterium]
MKRTLKALLALASAVLFAGGVHAQQQELNFGIISTDSSSALRQLWQPFLDDMSKATGVKVNGFFATDYTGIIEGMRFGKLQVAWHGNKSAIEAVDRAGGEVFAQFIDLEGRPGYYSYIITHRDSPLKSIDDMLANGKTLSFGMGDPQSTSGTLVPTYYVFSQRKLDPKNVFRVTRSANHGGNLLAVLNKQIDVATNNSEELDKLKLRDAAKREEVKILWTSPLIPRDPLVWRKDLPAEMKDKIRKFVLGYGKDQREKDILKGMQQIAGFRDSTDLQLVPIRQLELYKDRIKFENDDKMNAQERTTKIADIDRKLADLAKLVK